MRLEVPEPVTVGGLNVHVGAGDTAGAMLPQDRFKVPLNPFKPVMVIVEVADPPGATVEGESGEALRVKSGGAL